MTKKVIKELKPRIKEIKEEKDESELEEDIEKAEQETREAVQSGDFQAPSIVLESETEAPRRTQIQQETRERREIETTNASYTTTQSRETYREYTPPQMRVSEVVEDRRISPMFNQTLQGKQVIENRAIQRTEEREETYETRRQKRKTYPWEV